MARKFTFVLGGAASGKSAYAENLANSCGLAKVYLASAQAFDAEMQAKINVHISRRDAGWTTVEAPLEVAAALRALNGDQVCLWDCATLWLSNQILAEADLDTAQADVLGALQSCAAEVIVVSNEVGQGVVPEHALGRQFREAQGRFNITLAARADRVVQVIAGLPNVLKGERP